MIFLGLVGIIFYLSFNSLYDLLGLQENCTDVDIELAFLRRMDDIIKEPYDDDSFLYYYAYKVLSNKVRRVYYDLTNNMELYPPTSFLSSFISRLFHRKPFIQYKPLDSSDLNTKAAIGYRNGQYLFFICPPTDDPKNYEKGLLFRNLRDLYDDVIEFSRFSTPDEMRYGLFGNANVDNQLCFVHKQNGIRQSFILFSEAIEGVETEISSKINLPTKKIRKFSKLISLINQNAKSKKKSIVIFDKSRRLDLHILFQLMNMPKSIPIVFYNHDLPQAITYFNLTELPAILIQNGNDNFSILYQDEFQYVPQYASTLFFPFTEESLYDDCFTNCFVYIGDVNQTLINQFHNYHYKSIGTISSNSLFAQKNKLPNNSWIYVESAYRQITKIERKDILQFGANSEEMLNSLVKYIFDPSDLKRISKWKSFQLKLDQYKQTFLEYYLNLTTANIFFHVTLALFVYFVS